MRRISSRSISNAQIPDVLTVYTRDVVLKRSQGLGGPEQGGGRRGRIHALSKASRQRLVRTARNVEPLDLHAVVTYPRVFPTDGVIVRRHRRRLLDRLRRRGYRGLWWLEFQLRGAPHLHLALTLGSAGSARSADGLEAERRWLARAWFEIVGSGDADHLAMGTYLDYWRSGVHGLQDYVSKEAAKWVQKEVPEGYEHVGRFWGLFGGARVERREVYQLREELAPTVRVARGAERADRRRVLLKPRKDAGRVGFTAYDAAPAVTRWLSEGG